MHPLADPPPDVTGTFLQYGAVGAIAVILGLFAWSAYKRERDRADRLEALVQSMNDRLVDRLADLLKDTRDSLKDVNDYLSDLVRRRRP